MSRSAAALAAALVLTYAAERWLDLGVITALSIGAIALITLTHPHQAKPAITLAVAMPLVALIHADAKWLRLTLTLYALYALLTIVCTLIRRKSTATLKNK